MDGDAMCAAKASVARGCNTVSTDPGQSHLWNFYLRFHAFCRDAWVAVCKHNLPGSESCWLHCTELYESYSFLRQTRRTTWG